MPAVLQRVRARQRPDTQYAAVVPLFIDALLAGEAPVVHGDGAQSRDFTFVADTVQPPTCGRGAGGGAPAGCSTSPGAARVVLDLLGALGAARPAITLACLARPGTSATSHADIGAAWRLGYEPRCRWRRAHPHAGSVSTR